MLKVLLIIAIVVQGLVLYSILGFLVFLVFEKLDGSNWREDWNNGEGYIGWIILGWPLLIVVAVIAGPILAVCKVIDEIASKGDR